MDSRDQRVRTETDRSDCTFTLKETGAPPDDGGWALMVEFHEPGLPEIERADSFLMLHFAPGTSQHSATAFAEQMRAHITAMSQTRLMR